MFLQCARDFAKLCGDRDERVNHMISKCCKLSRKEYKSWYDGLGKMISWEVYNCLKFNLLENCHLYQLEYLPGIVRKSLRFWATKIFQNPIHESAPIVNQQKETDMSSFTFCLSSGHLTKRKKKRKDRQITKIRSKS